MDYKIVSWPKFDFSKINDIKTCQKSNGQFPNHLPKIQKKPENDLKKSEEISASQNLDKKVTTKENPAIFEEKTHEEKKKDWTNWQEFINSVQILRPENEQKKAELLKLRSKIANFREFSFIDIAKNLVFSDGNPFSKLMLIGEAPGQEEDESGKPFVGRSGRLLSNLLEEIGLNRGNYYITNVVYWRPPANRTPTLEEIDKMRPFLHEHIQIVDPELIITVGAIATKALEIEIGISKAQGNIFEKPIFGRNYRVFPVYHPSYALRLPPKKKELWLSLLKMYEILQKNT